MRKEFDKPTIDLVEALPDGEWAVRWDIIPKLDENGNEIGIYSCEEEIFNHIPEINEIKRTIIDWHNKLIDDAILKGCIWNNMHIWLSMENQFNYKSIFDIAVMTESLTQQSEISESIDKSESIFPVKFKFGSDTHPQYYTFNNLDELSDFYKYVLKYIQNCYTLGWYKKDNFDYSVYKDFIRKLK